MKINTASMAVILGTVSATTMFAVTPAAQAAAGPDLILAFGLQIHSQIAHLQHLTRLDAQPAPDRDTIQKSP